MGEGEGEGDSDGDGTAESEDWGKGRDGAALGSAETVREGRTEAVTVGIVWPRLVELKEGRRDGEKGAVPVGAVGVRGREGEAVGCVLRSAVVEAVRETVVVCEIEGVALLARVAQELALPLGGEGVGEGTGVLDWGIKEGRGLFEGCALDVSVREGDKECLDELDTGWKNAVEERVADGELDCG